MHNKNKKVVIIIAFTDFKDEEYFIPKEILEESGIKVVTASNSKGIARSIAKKETKVDISLDELNVADYDAIVFIGGPGCVENLDNQTSYQIAKEAIKQDKVLAAICISPIILAKAGVLKGKKATVWSNPADKSPIEILEQNKAVYEDKDVVVDGRIITACGPEAAEEFGKAIVESLK